MCIYLQDMKFLLSMLSLGQLYTDDTNDDNDNADANDDDADANDDNANNDDSDT